MERDGGPVSFVFDACILSPECIPAFSTSCKVTSACSFHHVAEYPHNIWLFSMPNNLVLCLSHRAFEGCKAPKDVFASVKANIARSDNKV